MDKVDHEECLLWPLTGTAFVPFVSFCSKSFTIGFVIEFVLIRVIRVKRLFIIGSSVTLVSLSTLN